MKGTPRKAQLTARNPPARQEGEELEERSRGPQPPHPVSPRSLDPPWAEPWPPWERHSLWPHGGRGSRPSPIAFTHSPPPFCFGGRRQLQGSSDREAARPGSPGLAHQPTRGKHRCGRIGSEATAVAQVTSNPLVLAPLA